MWALSQSSFHLFHVTRVTLALGFAKGEGDRGECYNASTEHKKLSSKLSSLLPTLTIPFPPQVAAHPVPVKDSFRLIQKLLVVCLCMCTCMYMYTEIVSFLVLKFLGLVIF